MSLPGSAPLGGLVGGPRGQQNQGATPQEQQMIKYMQSAMESCPTKTAMAGVMGAGLGAMFGLFMSSMRYDAPGALNPSAPDVSSLPIRQQLRVGLRDMGRSAYSSGRNFGLVGAIFSGTECCIEGLRAKNELSNGVAAGCITGAVLARNGGPQAVAIGCAGFAAFSAAIDSYMRMPNESDKGGKID